LAMGDIVEAKGHSVMALGRGCVALPSAPVQAFVDFGQLDRSLRIVALNSTRSVLAWCASPHERITCCAVAHDGRSFVTAGRDDATWLWRVRWGGRQPRCELVKENLPLAGQTVQMTSLCICSTNAVIVGGGADGSLLVWSAASLAPLWQDTATAASGEVVAVAVSAGSGAVLAATAHSVVVWSCSGARLAQMELSTRAPIRSLVTSQQGEMLRSNLIFTGHDDGEMIAWRLAIGLPDSHPQKRWHHLTDRVRGLPNIVASQKNQLPFRLSLERQMVGHKAAVTIIRTARSDTNVFSADLNGQPLVWSLSRARHESTFHSYT